MTRKVDQNIALRNLCKTHRTFQGLPSMGMFCLLSLIKSWFFCSFSYFGHLTTWTICSRHRYTNTSAGKKNNNWIPPNPRAWSRTFRDQAWALPLKVQARSFQNSNFSIEISLACNIVLVLGMQDNDLIHIYTEKWFLCSFRKLYQEKNGLKINPVVLCLNWT